MKYLLGIDFGGGSSKATLLSHQGKVAATAVTEYPTLYPKTGYAEQNPGDWYDAVKVGIAKLIKESGVSPCDITAVCLDGQLTPPLSPMTILTLLCRQSTGRTREALKRRNI